MGGGGPVTSQAGFTVVEMLVTLAVAAIVLTLAIPSFRESAANRKVRAVADDLQYSLAYARTEAINRGARVTLCRSSDGATCGGSWETGWIVFSDGGTAGVVDGGDTVLRVYSGQPNVTVTMPANYSSYISYRANGLSQGNGGLANGTIPVCGETTQDRRIVINITGRARTEAATC